MWSAAAAGKDSSKSPAIARKSRIFTPQKLTQDTGQAPSFVDPRLQDASRANSSGAPRRPAGAWRDGSHDMIRRNEVGCGVSARPVGFLRLAADLPVAVPRVLSHGGQHVVLSSRRRFG